MSAGLLKPRTALSTVLADIRYTQSRAQAHPLTAALAPPFQQRRDEWKLVNDEEIAWAEALSDAHALVDAADDALDAWSSKLSKVVLTITGDDRGHWLYLHFFGGKSLSQFVRPVLGGQLEAMRKWSDSLAKSTIPELSALAPELAALLTQADAAVTARDEAQQNNKFFREVGARRLFIDRVNATRKTAHTELVKLAIATPGLPGDFADQFFRRAAADEEEEPTIASVTAQIAAVDDQKQELLALLGELQKAAEDAAKAAQQKHEAEAELAALKKQADENARRQAELEKQLHKK